MFCNKCGKKNKKDSKFCFNCGINLEEKKKINVNELQVSAKVGYYARIVALILLIINIGIILFGIISLFSSTSNSSDDSLGYAILFLMFIGPVILLGYLFGSAFLTIGLPSIWISREKKVDTYVEVFRFIG